MQRIIIHWTAGSHTASALDREHYHFLVEGDGTELSGQWPVSANAKIVGSNYAAHTLGTNTGSIGVAVCAMAGAKERPFNAGRFPITVTQMDAMAALVGRLCAKYKIPVTRTTVLTHAEVQTTLGINQRGKWDIMWLPGMAAADDPLKVGDRIREMVATSMARPPWRPDVEPIDTPPSTPDWLSKLIARIIVFLKG